jgi:predicted DNA-binding transcriptional regulator YafY
MYTTANETSEQTLARLIRAMDHGFPVTVTYTKADGTETLRTIEVYDVATTKAGAIVLKAMDRDSQEARTFRLDRIAAYTIHRTAYTVPVEPATQTPTGHSLNAAAAILAPAPGVAAPLVPITTAQRIDILVGYLASA